MHQAVQTDPLFAMSVALLMRLSITFHVFMSPQGALYPDGKDIHAADLISLAFVKRIEQSEALFQVLRDERPDEVMEWWAGQEVTP